MAGGARYGVGGADEGRSRVSKRTAGEPPSGFQELRDRVLIHLWQIRKIQKKHPEYTMALLIAIASEALSRCLAKKGHSEFLRLLKRKYDSTFVLDSMCG